MSEMGVPGDERSVFRTELAAGPAAPSLLRRAFRAWLDGWGWPEDEAEDLMLALNEAVTNVVEHAYGRERGDVRVHAEIVLAPGGRRWVRTTVVDFGRWRPISPNRGHRGRGLRMMRGCTAWLGVDPTPAGTCITMLSRPCAASARFDHRASDRDHDAA